MRKVTGYTVILVLFILMVLSGCSNQSLSPTEGFIDVTGGKVWYKIVGSGNQTPLLVVHGGKGVSSAYLKPLEAISSERPVIFYDQLGCGNSKAPNDTALWTVERFAGEIPQIIAALNLRKVHLYGHSWGSILISEALANNSDGVQSVIFSGAAFDLNRMMKDKNRHLHSLPDSIYTVIEEHEANNTTDSPEYQAAFMVHMTTFFVRKQPWSEDLLKTISTMNIEMGNYFFGTRSFVPDGNMAGYDGSDNLSKINVPCLLMAGEYDGSNGETIEYYQSLIKDSEIKIMENCGHLSIHDNPEEEIKNINDFLKRVEE